MFGYTYLTTLSQHGYFLTIRGQWETPAWIAGTLQIDDESFIQMLKNLNIKFYKYDIYYFENEKDAQEAVDAINIIAKLNHNKMYMQ